MEIASYARFSVLFSKGCISRSIIRVAHKRMVYLTIYLPRYCFLMKNNRSARVQPLDVTMTFLFCFLMHSSGKVIISSCALLKIGASNCVALSLSELRIIKLMHVWQLLFRTFPLD